MQLEAEEATMLQALLNVNYPLIDDVNRKLWTRRVRAMQEGTYVDVEVIDSSDGPQVQAKFYIDGKLFGKGSQLRHSQDTKLSKLGGIVKRFPCKFICGDPKETAISVEVKAKKPRKERKIANTDCGTIELQGPEEIGEPAGGQPNECERGAPVD